MENNVTFFKGLSSRHSQNLNSMNSNERKTKLALQVPSPCPRLRARPNYKLSSDTKCPHVLAKVCFTIFLKRLENFLITTLAF